MGLRTRATIAFGVTGLAVAVVFATVTYGLARSYLVDQRQSTGEQQAFVNARLARAVLRTPEPDIRSLLASLDRGTGSSAVLRYEGDTYSTSVTSGPDAIPSDLARLVSEGRAGHQRFRDSSGQLHLAVGVPIAAVDAAYFEVFSLQELDRTLDLLARALAIGVAVAAIAAGVIGLPSYADHQAAFTAVVALPAVVAEAAFALWLLFRAGTRSMRPGRRDERWQDAGASSLDGG